MGMTAMTPGSNVPLTAARITVEVTAPADLDVSALLLGADGKVRSDDDFVFYNQPAAPGVRYEDGAVTVEPAGVPQDVEKIVVTASPGTPGRTFAGLEPTASVTGDGAPVAVFTPAGLGDETALVVVEVYRRGAGWKLRAVGQGYANGLSGIATDFGVTVEEAAGAPQPAGAPAPPASPAGATPPQPPAPGGFGPPPTAFGAPAPAGAPAVLPPPTGLPAGQVPAPSGPAPSGAPRVSLDKGRVNLRKNESVSLVKGGRPLLSAVRMGLGWEPARFGRSIDLDASVVVYGPGGDHLESCYFGRKEALGGAVRHLGDNLTGNGGGDDETIVVDLGALPQQAAALVFTVNSYSGQRFTKVASAYCRLLEGGTGEELVRFDLTNSEDRTGVMMCKLVRQPAGEWEMTGLGVFADAQTVRGMVGPGRALL